MPSFLSELFSSKLLRGFYKDEKPEIPFELNGNKQEQRRMISLVNRIARGSETGRKTLEKAMKEGYSLCFEMQFGAGGFCAPKEKVVGLNPLFSDGSLIGTLAHETRHAEQYVNGAMEGGYSHDYALSAQLVEKRLMEADAVAFSVSVAHDMSKGLDDEPLRKVQDNYPRPARQYKESISSGSGARNEAMTNAVMAWYDDEMTKLSYEQSYIIAPLSYGWMFKNKTGEFESYPASESVKKVCQIEGENYFTRSPSVLETPERAGLSDFSAAWMQDYVKECEKHNAQKMDPSISKLPVYRLSDFTRRKLEKAGMFMPEPLCAEGVEMLKKQEQEKQASVSVVVKNVQAAKNAR